MKYEGTIYRPPSEARSLLIQVTIGCSHNKCAFCIMYRDVNFRIKPLSEVKKELEEASLLYKGHIRKIFLCDGNALVLKTEHLLEILGYIKELFPGCQSVGIYAGPADVRKKNTAELKALHEAGLTIAYIGIESGSDKVLTLVNKGQTSQDMIDAANIIRPSGIKTSIMAISGLGGREHSKEHAIETARVLSAMNPDYVGLLSLMIIEGTELYESVKNGEFKVLTAEEVAQEMLLLVEHLELDNCFFSSAHASNYITLKGNMPQDKHRMISEIKFYLDNEIYKSEAYRGL